MIRTFRKITPSVDAIQYTHLSQYCEIKEFVYNKGNSIACNFYDNNFQIKQVKGINPIIDCTIGDWIIRNENGEYFVMKSEIFNEIYEETNEDV